MKYLKFTLVAIVLLAMNSSCSFAQTEDSETIMVIKEDQVLPGLTDEYETSLASLNEYFTEKKTTDFAYFAHLQDDYTYTHVVPIDKLENLNNGLHAYVAKKINDPELDLILDYLDDATESSRYYVTSYRPELSYVPDKNDWGDNSTYRKWSYCHFESGSKKEVEKTLQLWKSMYEKKNANMGYRVYQGLIGIEESVYILATWAESPLEYHKMLEETSTLLGSDGASIWSKMMQDATAIKVVEGWYLPQYSYTQGKTLAK